MEQSFSKSKDSIFDESPSDIIEKAYQSPEISDEGVTRIREQLEKETHIVLNFDETITYESTITPLIKTLGEVAPNRKDQLLRDRMKWGKKERGFIDSGESVVNAFYTKVIQGISKTELEKAYSKVLNEVDINPNVEKVLRNIKEVYNPKRIPIFVLSLNNKQLVELFYKRHKKMFESYDVDITGIMCNQVVFDKNNRISGVTEYVTNENKYEYIPHNGIMLADNRETHILIERGINALNIQGDRYQPILMEMTILSLKLRNFLHSINKEELESEKAGLAVEMLTEIKKIKHVWEFPLKTQKEMNIRQQENIIKISILRKRLDKYNKL